METDKLQRRIDLILATSFLVFGVVSLITLFGVVVMENYGGQLSPIVNFNFYIIDFPKALKSLFKGAPGPGQVVDVAADAVIVIFYVITLITTIVSLVYSVINTIGLYQNKHEIKLKRYAGCIVVPFIYFCYVISSLYFNSGSDKLFWGWAPILSTVMVAISLIGYWARKIIIVKGDKKMRLFEELRTLTAALLFVAGAVGIFKQITYNGMNTSGAHLFIDSVRSITTIEEVEDKERIIYAVLSAIGGLCLAVSALCCLFTGIGDFSKSKKPFKHLKTSIIALIFGVAGSIVLLCNHQWLGIGSLIMIIFLVLAIGLLITTDKMALSIKKENETIVSDEEKIATNE